MKLINYIGRTYNFNYIFYFLKLIAEITFIKSVKSCCQLFVTGWLHLSYTKYNNLFVLYF